jgi:hypothetical protein
MDISQSNAKLSEDDLKIIKESYMLGILEDEQSFDLRLLVRGWYERGYFDRIDEEFPA